MSKEKIKSFVTAICASAIVALCIGVKEGTVNEKYVPMLVGALTTISRVDR